jgi:hypothetical protein
MTGGVAARFNAVGVVDEPVEDAVGQHGIAYLFVPPRDSQKFMGIPNRKRRLISEG